MATGFVSNHKIDDKDARHEAKVMNVILTRYREARRSKVTGELLFRVTMNKGGPTNVFTEVGVTYKILEET